MAKISLKKYLNELVEHPLDYFLNYKMEEFAFNNNDKTKVKTNFIAKQDIRIIQDEVKFKVKTWITVLGVSATKNFLERLLRNLPQYERKDPLIVELAFAISHEIKKIDLKNSENLASLNITTTTTLNIKKFEKLYNINSNYELGLQARQNIIIARKITRYSTFNFEYLMKMCELFLVGEVIDILNDKVNCTLTLILKDNLDNISTLKEFKAHLEEFSPAFYEINITN